MDNFQGARICGMDNMRHRQRWYLARLLKISLAASCGLMITLCNAGATQCLAQQQDPVDVVRVDTNLVVFDAQVIDKKSKRTIGDLTKEDFELTDNGVRQQISYVSRDELPLSIMLMLDVSGSVRPIIHQIRDGALNALRRLKPNDQVAIIAFGTDHKLVQDFTSDRALVSRQIEDVTADDRLGNATYLGAALQTAALHMEHAPTATSRRVIIIITDNIAVTTTREQRQVLEHLFDTGTVVYGLVVRGGIGKFFNVMSLGQFKGVNKFVDETGGEILGARQKEVDARLGVVIDHLRARYAIGFRPSNTNDDSKFRSVEIKVRAAKKRKEEPVVFTKRGYYFRSRS